MPGHAVAAAAHRDSAGPASRAKRDAPRTTSASSTHWAITAGPPVDHRVEDGPGLVVARIVRGEHVAGQILAQRGESRARLRWGAMEAPPSVQGLMDFQPRRAGRSGPVGRPAAPRLAPSGQPPYAPDAVSRRAVSISGTWLKACGKLPTWRCSRGSYSSASSPRSLRSASSLSNSLRASSTRPIIARSSASQNEQARKAPSSPGSPSTPSSLARGRVAQDEAVRGGQLALDRLDGADHPLVVRRQEAHLRDEQQRGVQLLRAVGLREGVALLVVALLAHVPVDVVAQLAPPLQRAVRVAGLDRA